MLECYVSNHHRSKTTHSENTFVLLEDAAVFFSLKYAELLSTFYYQ